MKVYLFDMFVSIAYFFSNILFLFLGLEKLYCLKFYMLNYRILKFLDLEFLTLKLNHLFRD